MSTDLQRLHRLADALQHHRMARRDLLRAGLATTAAAIAPAGAVSAAPLRPSLPNLPLSLAQGLAPGAALVTSRRLPLAGISESQAAPLMQGDLRTWSDVGSPLPAPVKLLAVESNPPRGMSATMVADYEALIDALDETPGGFAMLPLEMIDARVNTLDFDGVNPLLAEATAENPVVRIGVAGDIIFGRHGGTQQLAYDDWLLPMAQVKDFLRTFDVTVANFECFVSESIDLETVDTLDFVTRPQSLQGLADAGIDAVTMANNHAVFSAGNYGIPGMQETMQHLTEHGIPQFGVGMSLDEARAPWVTEVNGISIAFLGIDGVTANDDFPTDGAVVGGVNVGATATTGGTNPFNMAQVTADIEALAGQHDIVLPYFHMGSQYRWAPVQWVVDAGRQAIDAGATAVLASHPHATMGMEFYRGKPIFHSIGNFVYDQMFSVETREGYFLELTFLGRELKAFRLHPVETLNWVQPRFLCGSQLASFNDRFWRSTDFLRKNRNWNRDLTRP